MKTREKYKTVLLGLALLLTAKAVFAKSGDFAIDKPVTEHVLGIEEFIELAAKNDTEFEAILIEELTLQYRKDLKLPARDLVLDVKADYDFFVSQDREEPEGAVALSKLFPNSATSVSVGYETNASFSSRINSTEFSVAVSQAIAGDAFGRSARLQDKIVGAEIEVIQHQIIEAYEDYLAEIVWAYYDWYAAYENLNISRSSYQDNLKLLKNIEDRRKSSIALAIDVNKIKLQVLAKKEKLIELEEAYNNKFNFIETALRFKNTKGLIPKEPGMYSDFIISFKADFGRFWKHSRTYKMLELLKSKTSLEVEKEADDLLPSVNLRLGYTMNGDNFEIDNDEGMVFAGISLKLPFSDQVDRAQYETARIQRKKTGLQAANTHYRLFRDMRNLSLQIEKERQLVETDQEKISLARSILADEEENYSYGKVTLNDYISSVNVLDTNRFNLIEHNTQYQKLIVEWLRLTDRLIGEKELKNF
ncbi:MAG: TolC family protein [Candidatus Omnitrophica bacterium]|nr:TolC family protein [Candidatus Omnitrophota bacterium]